PTGDLLWQTARDLTSPYACAFALVVGTCAAAEHSSVLIDMIDGKTLADAYTAKISRANVQYAELDPVLRDLNGDGSTDLMLFESRGAASSSLYQGVVSGHDGSVPW